MKTMLFTKGFCGYKIHIAYISIYKKYTQRTRKLFRSVRQTFTRRISSTVGRSSRSILFE